MKTIKQKPNSKDCLACVAAMATGTTVGDYKKYCIDTDLLPGQEFTFIRYLWYRGFMAGFYFGEDGLHGVIGLSQLESVNILHVPALLAVESTSKETIKQGASHAVYWDGKKIHDPKEKRPDEDYKIISVLPIVINKT